MHHLLLMFKLNSWNFPTGIFFLSSINLDRIQKISSLNTFLKEDIALQRKYWSAPWWVGAEHQASYGRSIHLALLIMPTAVTSTIMMLGSCNFA